MTSLMILDESPEVERVRSLLGELPNAHFRACQLDSAQLGKYWELWAHDPGGPLNAFVAAVGLGVATAPVGRWDPIARDQARCLLAVALQWEQAYDTRRVGVSVAERIASAFVELFAEQARFFTNGTVENTPRGLCTTAWYGSVTLATFETGVVAVDEDRIGLLYLADED